MKNESSNEIDLLSLLARFIHLLKRNVALIVICVVVMIGISLGFFYSAKKVYASRMMIFSDILTESYAEKLAVTIQSLIYDGNLALLASRLNLTEEEAALVRDLSIASALDEAAARVEEKEKLFLVVTVRVLDNAVLPKLQQGILDYIRENEFARVREDQKRKFLTELIARVDIEIGKMEVIKRRISEGDLRGDGMLLMDPTNPFASTVELYEQKLELESELALLRSVQLVEGFTPLDRPIKPKLSVYVPAGFLAGLLLAAGIIVLNFVAKITVT